MIGSNDLSTSLSEAELEELSEFLTQRCLPYGGMPLSMLDGYLTSIVSCPTFIAPSTWLPPVWEARDGDAAEGDAADVDDDPVDDGFAFTSMAETQRYSTLVLRCMNEIVRDMERDGAAPIFLTRTADDGSSVDLANLWCAGYVAGIGLARAAWEPLMREGSEAEKFFFPIFELAAPFLNDDDEEDEDLVGALTAKPHQDELTALVAACADAIYRRARQMRQPVPPSGPIRRASKPGRNDACSCGSGRKFKKCCGVA